MTTIAQTFGVQPPMLSKYKQTVPCVNPSLAVGFELETEGCERNSVDGWRKLCNKHNIRVEADNSLRGVAYEFITNPMETQCALPAIGNFFKEAGFTGENYSDRCSVHVHVNCTDLEMEQVSNIALLYTVLEEVLFEFVGGDRDSNIYCIPWNQCRSHLDLINRFLSKPNNALRNWNKYTALNLIPLASYGTIEFRQMHGTCDIDKLTTWLNIIGAMFKYAKEVTLKDLITEIKTLNSTSQYEGFFNRILAGSLPYNEAYRQKLEEGVIFAKFSLISMDSREKKSEEIYQDQYQAVWAAAPIEVEDAREELRRRINAFNINVGGGRIEPGLVPPAMPLRRAAAQQLRPAQVIMDELEEDGE